MELIFWLAAFMIFYSYFGYPSCLIAILAVRKVKGFISQHKNNTATNELAGGEGNAFASVSLIITAYNEEKRIEEKIKNALALSYPQEKIEIIIASDCSSDRTDEIVKGYADQGIKLVRAPERKGKENAQKHAIDASKGDILVFSDVATILKPDALNNIVANFSDPTIGCVSSVDKFIDKDGNVSGEGAYVRYEMFLRHLETEANTLVGLSGSFFAARREVCVRWETDLQSDFNTLLNSVKAGLRGISDPKSIGYYHNIADEKKEFQRKVRTVLRGISVLMRNLSLLNINEYGLFSWQLFSHKLCRWMVPFFMIVALLTNIMAVIQNNTLKLMLIFHLMFYSMALYYYLTEIKNLWADKLSGGPIASLLTIFKPAFKILYFFVSVNYSILIAWMDYAKGRRATFWEPSKR